MSNFLYLCLLLGTVMLYAGAVALEVVGAKWDDSPTRLVRTIQCIIAVGIGMILGSVATLGYIQT